MVQLDKEDFIICETPICRGAMDNKGFCLCCRRGLLAYVYSGVSDRMNMNECLSGGKWLLYSMALWP